MLKKCRCQEPLKYVVKNVLGHSHVLESLLHKSSGMDMDQKKIHGDQQVIQHLISSPDIGFDNLNSTIPVGDSHLQTAKRYKLKQRRHKFID